MHSPELSVLRASGLNPASARTCLNRDRPLLWLPARCEKAADMMGAERMEQSAPPATLASTALR